MFKNALTEKMPCWNCRDIDRCLILESLLQSLEEAKVFRWNVEGLTFTCLRIVTVGT